MASLSLQAQSGMGFVAYPDRLLQQQAEFAAYDPEHLEDANWGRYSHLFWLFKYVVGGLVGDAPVDSKFVDDTCVVEGGPAMNMASGGDQGAASSGSAASQPATSSFTVSWASLKPDEKRFRNWRPDIDMSNQEVLRKFARAAGLCGANTRVWEKTVLQRREQSQILNCLLGEVIKYRKEHGLPRFSRSYIMELLAVITKKMDSESEENPCLAVLFKLSTLHWFTH